MSKFKVVLAEVERDGCPIQILSTSVEAPTWEKALQKVRKPSEFISPFWVVRRIQDEGGEVCFDGFYRKS